MGALLGLALGCGLLLVGWAVAAPTSGWAVPSTVARRPLRQLLDEAGLTGVRVAVLLLGCAASSAVAFVLLAGLSRSLVLAAAFAAMAAWAPLSAVRGMRERRRASLGAAWPDVVDDLTSAIRAGLALPEALVQVAARSPQPLHAAFGSFVAEYRATARFGPALDVLKRDLADPVGDRVVESLRVARDVGGSDLGGLLGTLSGFLRDDNRTRDELLARQAWTVNGARVAVAAPWLVLGLLALRPAAVAAYDSVAGAVVLGGGATACLVAYRVMRLVGRLPHEPRVFG